MKNLIVVFILIVFTSCTSVQRGGYFNLPPAENRYAKKYYWQHEKFKSVNKKTKKPATAYNNR